MEVIFESLHTTFIGERGVRGGCLRTELLFFQERWRALRKQVGMGFPSGAVVKNPPADAGDVRDADSIPRLGRSPRVVNGNPL